MPMVFPYSWDGWTTQTDSMCDLYLTASEHIVRNYGYSQYIVPMRLDSIPKDTSIETSTNFLYQQIRVPVTGPDF